MKKILLILFVLFCTAQSFGQFINNLPQGNPKTQIYQLGGAGADSGFIWRTSFADTAAANKGFLKNIAGIVIRVGNSLYQRANCKCEWILINQAPNTPGTFTGVDSITINVDTTGFLYWISGTSTFVPFGGSASIVGDTLLCITTSAGENCYPITGDVIVESPDSMTINGSLACWYLDGVPTCITINPLGAYFNDVRLSADSLTYDFYNGNVYIKSVPTLVKSVQGVGRIIIRDSSNGKTVWYWDGTGLAQNGTYLVSEGAVVLVDSTLTINEPIVWKFNGADSVENSDQSFTINTAPTGYLRTDIIIIDSFGVFGKLVGDEDTIAAVAPSVPYNAVIVAYADIDGATITVSGALASTGNAIVYTNEFREQKTDSINLSWNEIIRRMRINGDVSISQDKQMAFGDFNSSIGLESGTGLVIKQNQGIISYRSVSPADTEFARFDRNSTLGYIDLPRFTIGSPTILNSAALNVPSTTRGLLCPVMTGVQMNAISSPATGLLIYNTDSLAHCWYNGSAWVKVGTGTGGSALTLQQVTTNGSTTTDSITFLRSSNRLANIGTYNVAGPLYSGRIDLRNSYDNNYMSIIPGGISFRQVDFSGRVQSVIFNSSLYNESNLAFPVPGNLLRYLTASVNGNYADTAGNIAITTPTFPNTSLAYLTGYNTFGSLLDTARTAVSLTTTGSSGAASYTAATGVFNIPNYTLAGLGGWSITGNSGTNPSSNFIGSTDDVPLVVRVNNVRVAAFDTSLKGTFNVGNDPYLPTTSQSKILISDTSIITTDLNKFGLLVVNSVGKTNGVAANGGNWGGYFEPRILASNTTSWSSFYGQTGVTGSNNTQPGALGTLTTGIGVEAAADYGGMTIDSAIGVRIRDAVKRTGATINNKIGLYVNRQGTGTSNIGILNLNGNNQFIGGTMVSGTNVLLISGTQPSSIAAASFGTNIQIAGSGTSAFASGALMAAFTAGYTGSNTTSAITGSNVSVGTGTGIIATNNRGLSMTVTGTTSGTNLANLGVASNGNANYGTVGYAITLKNNATNGGGVFLGRNTGTTPIQFGVYAGLNGTDPTFVSAALIADNSDQTSPIWVMRDNGTVVSTMSDGGNLFLGGTTATATAKLHIDASTATASTGQIKLAEGTRQTSAEDGTINYIANNLEFVETSTVYTLAKTLTATATLDFGSTLAGAVTDLTITVTGAADGDAVSIGVPNGSYPATGTFNAWVSAANTVTIRYANNSLTLTQDPASGTFRASVIKY